MNILMATDGYHLTMGYLMGEAAMQMETHVLYARTGGPLVVPNLAKVVAEYLCGGVTLADVAEADAFWSAQGVPFPIALLREIALSPSLPISVRGVRDGEVVLPGEPIAVITAPAIIAALPEPFVISAMQKAVQVATRFTKFSKALGWERRRLFEVGMRAANGRNDHDETVTLLADLGLGMTSSGEAGAIAGIAAGGSMGHRYTQRFTSDYAAFMQAVDRVLAYRCERGIGAKVKLTFLLDTRSTLGEGLPAAIHVAEERFPDIAEAIDLSVRLDSGDLAVQLRAVIRAFKARFGARGWLPGIILESGLQPEDVAGFEAIAAEEGYPREKLLYGVGGALVGGISRDFVSMVYKLSSVAGRPTMKFADEEDGGKESYPGNVTLMERETAEGIERMVALVQEITELRAKGWRETLIDIARNGVMVAPALSQAERNARIEARWEALAGHYIGNEKRPAQFPAKPQLSAGVALFAKRLRREQMSAADAA
jgi:nicotinic acid phosphoribosyltransferase